MMDPVRSRFDRITGGANVPFLRVVGVCPREHDLARSDLVGVGIIRVETGFATSRGILDRFVTSARVAGAPPTRLLRRILSP